MRPAPDAAALRQARIAAGLTRDELAVRAGIASATVYRLEHNRTAQPNRSTLAMLAQALGVDPADLRSEAPAPHADAPQTAREGGRHERPA